MLPWSGPAKTGSSPAPSQPNMPSFTQTRSPEPPEAPPINGPPSPNLAHEAAPPQQQPDSPIGGSMQQNANNALPQANNGNGAAGQQPSPLPQPPVPISSTAAARMPTDMSLSHVLQYLQHEFRRFDRDRNEWEIERGEMRARIALLEGERRGNENARSDLLRRVKMLEFALKGERSKYLSLTMSQQQLQLAQSTGKDALVSSAPTRQSMLRNEDRPTSPSSSSSEEAVSPNLLKANDKDDKLASSAASTSAQLSAIPQHVQFANLAKDPMIISRPNSALGLASVNFNDQAQETRDKFATSLGQSQAGSEKNASGSAGLPGSAASAAGWNPAIGRDPRGRAKRRDYLKQCLQEILYLTSSSTLNPLPELSSSGVERPLKMMVSPTAAAGQPNHSEQPPSTTMSSVAMELSASIPASTYANQAPVVAFNNNFPKPSHTPAQHGMRSPATSSSAMATAGITAQSMITDQYQPPIFPESSMQTAVERVIDPLGEISPAAESPFSDDAYIEPNSSDLPNGILPPLPADNTSQPPPTPNSPLMSLPDLDSLHDSAGFASQDDVPSDRLTAIYRPSSASAWKQQLRDANEKAIQQEAERALPNPMNADDGELANLSLVNSASTEMTDSTESDSLSKDRLVWQSRRILRSHLDSVRAVALGRSSDLTVVSGGDDSTIKVWRLNPHTLSPVSTRMSSMADSEPQVTLRGHSGAVTAIAIAPNQDRFYSASADQTVRCWRMPPRGREIYAPYDAGLSLATFEGHTDAIWDLTHIPLRIQDESLLATASADGTVRIWSAESSSPLRSSWKYHGADAQDGQPNGITPLPRPTALATCHYDYRKLAVTYQNAVTKIFDIETGKDILTLSSNESYDGTAATQINAVVTHPTMPLAVTAHEDRYIRMFDLNTGECTHSVLAHEDAVTSIDIDSGGLNLVSAGHDCSIRFWDLLSTRLSIQEMSSHRQKGDEGILAVKYHSVLPYIASGGADGIVKIYGRSAA